jgi:hypothetical protein
VNLRASQAFTAISICPTELHLYTSDCWHIDAKFCFKANLV